MLPQGGNQKRQKMINNIQQQIKAPKKQFNNFGKYNYRSCEDILEALKPILGSNSVNLTDEIQCHGEWIFIVATASIIDKDSKVLAQSKGVARLAENKKGMDEAQLSGATSSYARKYALGGLLALDDNQDIDAIMPSKTAETKPKVDLKQMSTKKGKEYILAFGDAEKAIEEISKSKTVQSDAKKFIEGLYNENA